MLPIEITRKFGEDGSLTVKVKIENEPVYTFTQFSPKITDEALERALTLSIPIARDKRERKVHRKEQLRAAREQKAEIEARWPDE